MEVKGLAAPNRFDVIQSLINIADRQALRHFEVFEDDATALDYHYAQAVSSLIMARNKIDALINDLTNVYMVTEEGVQEGRV